MIIIIIKIKSKPQLTSEPNGVQGFINFNPHACVSPFSNASGGYGSSIVQPITKIKTKTTKPIIAFIILPIKPALSPYP